ncbi:MAG: biopolymer transporter ExbD [Elusimicrobia bacterium]|nr:biopolymer transporter ExbD [Elusimicrobiota bacterium]
MALVETDRDEMITEINLTPLVDVCLVLVIIFMIVAPLFSRVLKPLILPGSTQAKLTEKNSIKVSVFPDGKIAVGPDFVAQSELAAALKKQIEAGAPPWALVRAGADVPHGRVMDVIRTVKEAGVSRLAFAAQPKPQGTRP